MIIFFTRHISPLGTLHSSQLLLQLFHQPQLRQIPNVHLAGLFHLNPRAHGPSKMPRRTTSTWLNTRLTPLKPRRRPRRQTTCFVIPISQRNHRHSRHPPHTLPPRQTRATRIRNHHSHNMRNTRQVHRVRVPLSGRFISAHMPSYRTEQ